MMPSGVGAISPACKLKERRSERGSALLIVFLFAAVLAISLYMEMPIVVFEAKRAKEQLLVDRGSEYAHAVKLYYRKFRAYPSSIDQLENTNRMRFLRHRFKDPMTGQDNWRLLHAGPGGQLTDSKVNPIGLNANGQGPATNNNASGFGTSSSGFANSTSFGNGNTGTSSFAASANAPPNTSVGGSAGNGTPGVAGGLPQRAAEMPLNGGGVSGAVTNADPTQSLLPTSAPDSGVQPINSQAAVSTPAGIPSAPGQQAQSASGASLSNPMQGVQGLFNNPNPSNPSNTATAAPLTNTGGANGTSPAGASFGITSTSSSGMGVMQSGGIAGVASTGKGESIKRVNDQSDYSLWEFYYDPTKDTAGVGQSGINPLSGVSQPANNTNVSAPSNSTFASPSSSPATSPSTPGSPASGTTAPAGSGSNPPVQL
jgi:hypothetical protein